MIAVTGIEDLVLENMLSIYPNPTENMVNIEFKSSDIADLEISLVNILGEEVIAPVEHNLVQNRVISMDVSAMTPGVYLIKISADKDMIVKKLTVK